MQKAGTENGSDVAEVEDEQQEELETIEKEQSGDGEEGDEGEQSDADDGVVVTIGEESPPQEEEPAPTWVRELRKKHQETTRRNRELEDEVARLKAPAKTAALGAKPTLADCDYDAEAFEAKLTAWHEQKRAADAEQAKREEAAENDRKAWQAKLENFTKLKGELKVKDYDEAEEVAKETFSVIQQGVILNGAENPAVLVYALGKSPKKAKELASISDPVKFAFAVAKLETQLKVSPRKAAPLPESTVRGSAPVSGSVDSHLLRLEAEADKTGDRSKLVAYKRQKKLKAG